MRAMYHFRDLVRYVVIASVTVSTHVLRRTSCERRASTRPRRMRHGSNAMF
eukprot:SAG11_NODE_557_length_8549_cov_5.574675_5_plen_51_part_00